MRVVLSPLSSMSAQIDPSEKELRWSGYSSLAMLPSFLCCIVLSVALLVIGWALRDRGIETGSVSFVPVVLFIWLIQLLRWGYRSITYVYRLTPHFLFIDFGFRHWPQKPVSLKEVAQVDTKKLFIKYLNVGQVRLHLLNGTMITLPGVFDPERFAREIESLRATCQSAAGS